MKIIGISGTNGSGKDTLGQILSDDYSWLFVSVTNLLRQEVARRGLPNERKYTRMVSAEWREEFGLGVLVDKAVEEFNKQSKKYKGLVISSLRNPGEVDEVHKLGGQVVWVDADPKVRYGRIDSRARGPEDHKTYEQFLEEEKAEMEYGGSANSLHMAGVKEKADIFIENNGDNLEDFKKAVQKALNL